MTRQLLALTRLEGGLLMVVGWGGSVDVSVTREVVVLVVGRWRRKTACRRRMLGPRG